MTIVVDAGHGYRLTNNNEVRYDPGAIGQLNGVEYHEAAIALDYARSLTYWLRTYHNAKVYLIAANKPENAWSLKRRQTYMPEADCFISIHLNGHKNTAAQGYETLYTLEHSLRFAEHVHKALQKAFVGRVDRGVKQQGLQVCRRTNPAILIEIGFITNPNELHTLLLRDTRVQFAMAVSQAVVDYLKQGRSKP